MRSNRSKLDAMSQLPQSATLEYEDLPFGPPPEEYHYRCPHCGVELWVNEAIIDFELGFAAFEGREVKMPTLGCPGCNQESQEYTGLKSPPEGR